jgi:hypothetical protein
MTKDDLPTDSRIGPTQPSGSDEAETVQGPGLEGWRANKAKNFTISLPFLYPI